MNLITELKQRGFFHACTNEPLLEKELKQNKITVYLGFDLTAKSLHVGNLIGIMVLRWLQKAGHNIIILLGNATTKLGDPSGKDETRQLLEIQTIEENKKSILECISQFLDIQKCTVVQNGDWLDKLNYIEMLRDVGVHFSINQMLTMESVKNRLDRQQHMSFLEFNYMILQAYDFYYLHNKYQCTLQVGGSDQWGNITQGINFLSRKNPDSNVFGMCWPLLTTSDGKKMGKSVNGAIWLKENMLSNFEYYQYFRNTADSDVKRLMKIFTEIDTDIIDNIPFDNHIQMNEAKDILAFEATKICRGEIAALEAQQKAKEIFSNREYTASKQHITKTQGIIDILVEVGFAKSKSDARKLVEQKGVKINGETISDYNYTATKEKFILQKGKKDFLEIVYLS